MKRILPAVAFDVETKTRRLQQENMTRKAEEKLDEYCEFWNVCAKGVRSLTLSPYNLSSVNEFLDDCVSALSSVDYAVFADDWQEHKDTHLLRVLAEVYGVPILEL